MRSKSVDSLIHALRMGDAIGADGVVLHPGSTREASRRTRRCARVGEVFRQALAESERCRLLLENTAGAGNTLGRTLRGAARADRPRRRRQAHRRLPRLLPHARQRLRHPRRPRSSREVVDDCDEDRRHRPPALPARERLADPARLEPRPPRAARRGRARRARAARRSSSEPRFEGLPALFEGRRGGQGARTHLEQIAICASLRKRGLARRRRRAKRGS